CATYLFSEYIGIPRYITGPSMLPTFSASPELIIEETLSAHRYPPRIARGDLIIYRAVYNPTKDVCKRVIGLPGDVICVDPDKALNGAERGEGVEHVIVPKNHVWVTGDNMSNSRDSREFGPIPMGLVQGRVWARVCC
ncbi:hypothetical protein M422DRAFT_190175, partial [Sphaerobolus stellatus SS14]